MPLNLQVMSDDEANEAFKRTRSADEVSEWVEMLRTSGISIGKTFKFQTETFEVETPTEDGTGSVTSPVEFLVDSVSEDDPDGVTVRTAKRRFNAAAKILGFSLTWKQPKGWLIAKAVSTVAVTSTEPTTEAPTTEPTTEAPTPPTPPTSTAQMPAGNGPRRVIRR